MPGFLKYLSGFIKVYARFSQVFIWVFSVPWVFLGYLYSSFSPFYDISDGKERR
jgi:hypothetical protein